MREGHVFEALLVTQIQNVEERERRAEGNRKRKGWRSAETEALLWGQKSVKSTLLAQSRIGGKGKKGAVLKNGRSAWDL